MTSKRTQRINPIILTAVTLTVAALTILIASAASAQQADKGQPYAKPFPMSITLEASTPVQALLIPRPPDATNARGTSAQRADSVNATSAASDVTNPLLLPVVTYGAVGSGLIEAAVADVNGDGKLDLVVTGGELEGSVGVLLGNGDGTFQPVVTYSTAGYYPVAVLVADVNGDGKPDLLVANANSLAKYSYGSVAVLLGNGNGTFQTAQTYATVPSMGSALAVADLNGDGKLDLIVDTGCLSGDCSNGGDGGVAVLLGNGNGTFQAAQLYDSGGLDPFSVVVADVNGDGIADLVTGNLGPVFNGDGSVGVLLGNGDGTFKATVTYDSGGGLTNSLVVADLNRDGKPDLVTASITFEGQDSGYVGVLLNNGDGTFKTPAVYGSGGLWPSALVVVDLSSRGIPDLVTANYGSQTLGVLLGNGDGTFYSGGSYSTGGIGLEYSYLAAADINGDGNPDILVTNNSCSSFCLSTVGVLLGTGNTTLQPVQTFGTGGGISSVTVADLTGNSKPDVIALNGCGNVSCDGTIGVLLNNTARPFNPTMTKLVPSANPAAPNQEVIYTATVTSQYGGTATGTVTFTDGTNTLGVVPLSSNQAAYSVSYKSTGPHTITAAYSGDANNGFSTSTPLTEGIAVLPTTSTTMVATSGSPSLIGQPVTFTATVTWNYGTIPNGQLVTFYDRDGDTVIGTGTTANGVATFTTSQLTATLHTIKATYAGNATFASSSAYVTQVVNGYATSTTLVSSLNPSIYGQSVTWTAKVTTSGSIPPTGEVNFTWSGNSIGGAPLNASGVATLTRSTENADTYPLTAVYEGDANNLPSTSAILNQVIKQTTSTATLTSSPNPSTQGQSVTFAAIINSPTTSPTGPVTFTAGKTVLGTGQLSGRKAIFTTSTLAVGATTVTATYYGDSNIAESSASVVQTVTAGTGNSTATTLTSSLNPASFGNQVTFTAQVRSSLGTPPNGEIVTFYNGSSVIGPGVLNGGAATMTTSLLSGGSSSITASYPGDSVFLGSTSAPLSQVIQTTTTAETVNWVADPPQNETFTATVTGPKGIPTGSVTFTVGNTVLGTSDLNANGAATLTVATLAVGSNTVTAAYSGDANNPPTSAWTTQIFVMPYNATMYLQQEEGFAAATTEFGAGTWPTNFVEYYSGLPNNPDPTGQVLVGSFDAGTIVNVGMYTVYGDLNGWSFSNQVSSNQPSLISFADLGNTLGLNHSITQQTSSTTWVLWLDDALSYLYDDDNNDVIMEIILVPN